MGGALSETELVEVVAQVGLVDGGIVAKYDCYEGTSAKAKFGGSLALHGANLFARKPL